MAGSTSNLSEASLDGESTRSTKGTERVRRFSNLDNDLLITTRVEKGLKRWKSLQTVISKKQEKVAKGARSKRLEPYKKERDELVEQMREDFPQLQSIFYDEYSNAFDRMDKRRTTTVDMRKENRETLSFRSAESEINQLKRQLENERKSKEEARLILLKLRSAESDINQLKKQLENERKSKEEALFRLRSAESEINQLKKQLENERKSNEEALFRQLRDNNPNTVELSDPNRPTKLSEQFSELYDKEWTDAFDELVKLLDDKEEKKIITYLRDIVLEIHSVCSDLSFSKIKTIEEAFVKPSVPSENTRIPTKILTTIKDGIKSMAPKLLEDIRELVLGRLEEKNFMDPVAGCLQHKHVKRYIDRCTEVCWYMSVQDPQLFMDGSKSADEKFDSNKYREYTKEVPHEDFVVWPVLYLYRGGQMLSKGVAQGANKDMIRQQ